MNVPRVTKASNARRRFMGRSTAVRTAPVYGRWPHELLVPMQAARGSSRAYARPYLALYGMAWSQRGMGRDATLRL